jgi:hypothetical protein
LTTFVIDASIAVKWMVEEDGTPRASALQAAEIETAADLIVARSGDAYRGSRPVFRSLPIAGAYPSVSRDVRLRARQAFMRACRFLALTCPAHTGGAFHCVSSRNDGRRSWIEESSAFPV